MCIPCANEKIPVQCSISLHYPQTVQTFSEIHRNHQKIIELPNPLYDGYIIYDDDLAAIKKRKGSLLLNKPYAVVPKGLLVSLECLLRHLSIETICFV